MPDPKKKLTADMKLEQYDWIAPLDARKNVYLNPLVYGAFKKASPNAYEHVIAYFLDEAETELGIFWDDGNDPDAIQVYPSKSEGTARFSLRLLCARYPALKVERGRNRPFPAQVKPYEGTPALILHVANIDSVPNQNRGKGKSSSPPTAGTESTSG